MIDRLRPAYSPGSMTCLPGIAPGGHLLPPRPARRWQVRRTRDGGGRGVRRFQGQVRVPQDQGGAQDRRIGEVGPQDHGGGRARGARAQATQVWFLRGRDDAGSRQSRRPGLHGRASEREVADGHQRDQGQGREGRASRRRSTASMARSSHTPPASAPTRSWPTGCRRKRPRRCRGTRVPWCIPTVDATAVLLQCLFDRFGSVFP